MIYFQTKSDFLDSFLLSESLCDLCDVQYKYISMTSLVELNLADLIECGFLPKNSSGTIILTVWHVVGKQEKIIINLVCSGFDV